MAMARITACPSIQNGEADEWAIYAPTAVGALVRRPYDPLSRTGELLRLDHRAFRPGGTLAEHLRAIVPQSGPLLIMVHGFLYAPEAPPGPMATKHPNPHSQIFHFVEPDFEPGGPVEAESHATPWPKRLGFADDAGESGLAIAFAWSSHPSYRNGTWRDWLNSVSWHERGATTYYGRAYRRAPAAGEALAALIVKLAEVAPGRTIRLFAHSLGTRVALSALRSLAEGRQRALRQVDRAVLLAGATHRSHARRVLDAVRRARLGQPEIFNLMTTRDDVLEYWGRRFAAFAAHKELDPMTWIGRLSRLVFGGTVIGLHGRPTRVRYRHWTDLRLDTPEIAARHGLPPPVHRVDHWTLFTFPPFAQFAASLLQLPDAANHVRPTPHHRFATVCEAVRHPVIRIS